LNIEHFIANAIIWLPVLVFSLCFHEFSHAFVAFKFGDTTARDMGRLTLSPLAHLDLTGSVVMILSGFRFGWAKPVPVNLYNVKNPRLADIWISAAGPISNIVLAVIGGMIVRSFGINLFQPEGTAAAMVVAGIRINIALALFNMIPLFPLDGSHVLKNLVSPEVGEKLINFERYAPMLLLLLVFTGAIGFLLGRPVNYITWIIAGS